MSNLRLDEIDLRIIYLLRKDSRISISDIARILGISRL
ncbi:MAG TPA: AsnC family transcriptional regulator [Thermoprotei archaeon]|nr:AsnC family transcriptional regulator [Thermoprotei archaeon]